MPHYINRTTREHWTGDPSECPWDSADRIEWPKGRTPPADVLATPERYRVIEGDTVRVATDAEQAAIDNSGEYLAAAKAARVAVIEQQKAAAEVAGVAVGDLTLAASAYDQGRLANLMVGINNAIELGAMTPESQVTIWDAAKVAHMITVAQYKQLAAGYMAACLALETRHAQALAAIDSAGTQAAVAAVNF